MDDVNYATDTASIVCNKNDTVEIILSGEVSREDLEKVLRQLLLIIVRLRDNGRQVLVFVNSTAAEDTGEDISDVAIKFLQTDFDYMAIYDESFGHRLIISKMARSVDNGEHRINVFKTVDEATAWVEKMRNQPEAIA